MMKEKIQEFKKKLRDLLLKYDAVISFDCGEGSDTHGLYGEKMVAIFKQNGIADHEEVLTNEWSVSANDLE